MDEMRMPENVMERRGEPAWGLLTDEQRASIARLADRWKTVSMEHIDTFGAMLCVVQNKDGGRMVIGVERDGYAHS